MTEDQLEQETLSWLAEVGYTVISGYDIAPDGINAERKNYVEVLLLGVNLNKRHQSPTRF
jgi:type I restriction enzyme R subunit